MPISMQTIYVSAQSGNDGNPGTADAPMQSLRHAAAAVGEGGTIVVLPGHYTFEEITLPPNVVLDPQRGAALEYNLVLFVPLLHINGEHRARFMTNLFANRSDPTYNEDQVRTLWHRWLDDQGLPPPPMPGTATPAATPGRPMPMATADEGPDPDMQWWTKQLGWTDDRP